MKITVLLQKARQEMSRIEYDTFSSILYQYNDLRLRLADIHQTVHKIASNLSVLSAHALTSEREVAGICSSLQRVQEQECGAF